MATYYVSTTGNDGNPGSVSQPWATARKASQTAAASDTVIFEDGTYNETQQFVPVNSGASGTPITFKARNRRQAIWNFGSGLMDGSKVFVDGKDFVVIEGLEITQAQKGTTVNDQMVVTQLCTGFALRDCEIHKCHTYLIRPVNETIDCVIEDCELHDCDQNLVDAVRAHNLTVRRCEFHDWGLTAGGTAYFSKGGARGAKIHDCIAHSPGASANYAFTHGGSTDAQFAWHPNGVDDGYEAYNHVGWNNVVICSSSVNLDAGFSFKGALNCTWANCVYIGNGAPSPSRPWVFEPGGGIAKGWDRDFACLNPHIYNMIVHTPTSAPTDFGDGLEGGLEVAYVVWYQNGGVAPPSGDGIWNVVNANPLFVNPTSDWRTQGGSPARDFGYPIIAIDYDGSLIDLARDYYGVGRVGRWDSGIAESDPKGSAIDESLLVRRGTTAVSEQSLLVEVTANSALGVVDSNEEAVFNVNTSLGLTQVPNGKVLQFFSDDFGTQTAGVDAATGNAEFAELFAGRLDIDGSAVQALQIRTGNADKINVNSSVNRLELVNGTDFRVYSGDYSGNVLEIDGATGNLSLSGAFDHNGTTFGAFSATPVTKPTVTGSRGGNAALASLLSALADLGLITNSTTS